MTSSLDGHRRHRLRWTSFLRRPKFVPLLSDAPAPALASSSLLDLKGDIVISARNLPRAPHALPPKPVPEICYSSPQSFPRLAGEKQEQQQTPVGDLLYF